MGSYQDDMDDLITNARAQGWRYDRANSNHHRFYAPNGKDIVTFASTPSDWRGFQNSLAAMKRAGYVPPNQGYSKPTLGDVMPTQPVPAEEERAEGETSQTKRGELTQGVIDYLKSRPGRTTSLNDIAAVMKGRFPSTSQDSVQVCLSRLVTAGTIRRVARGLFRWEEKASPPPAPILPHVVPPPAPAPEPSAIDDDIAELDRALVALSKIEEVVRRNRAVMQQFKELKAALDKLGLKV